MKKDVHVSELFQSTSSSGSRRRVRRPSKELEGVLAASNVAFITSEDCSEQRQRTPDSEPAADGNRKMRGSSAEALNAGRLEMAWYPDLSTYKYLGSKYLGSSLLMPNVGWLEQGRAFNAGPVPPELIIRLRRLIQKPANLCKGKHICDLCSMPDDARPIDDPSIDRFVDWIKGRSGNGEIHVDAVLALPPTAGSTHVE
jgi:hypothetical protein